MITVWLLIVHLVSGGITVSVVPDMQTCIAGSQLAMHYKNVKAIDCMPHTGGAA